MHMQLYMQLGSVSYLETQDCLQLHPWYGKLLVVPRVMTKRNNLVCHIRVPLIGSAADY